MKYLALSIHIPSYLFRGAHENYNLRPWPENCIYNSGHSQQDQPPKGTLWQVFTICSSPGSNQPLHLDTLSLEVQIESFKYTKFVAGIQTSGPQLFHPDANGFITDSAAQNFPVNMAIELSHTILDNSLEINDINPMYTGPVMTTNTGPYVHFTHPINNLQLRQPRQPQIDITKDL